MSRKLTSAALAVVGTFIDCDTAAYRSWTSTYSEVSFTIASQLLTEGRHKSRKPFGHR